MSWFSDMMGTSSINQNFNYDPSTTDVSGGNQWTYQGLTGLGTSSQNLLDMAGDSWDQSKQFMDPNSDYYNKRRGFMREDISSGIDTMNRNINEQLSSRGVGGGGIRNMLSAVNRSQIGEDVRRGSTEMYDRGIGMAANFQNQAIGATGQAGQLYGQQGQIGGTIQDRLLQQSMNNSNAQNQAKEFGITGSYNQQLENRQRQSSFVNNLIGSAASIGTAAFMPNPFNPTQ